MNSSVAHICPVRVRWKRFWNRPSTSFCFFDPTSVISIISLKVPVLSFQGSQITATKGMCRTPLNG
jgi:hypothetical protein